MTNEIITPTILRSLLLTKGITIDEKITDEDLETLISNKIKYISNFTNIDITPITRTEEHTNFSNKENILLNHYPVKSIESVSVDNNLLPSDKYHLNKNNGILIFLSFIKGKFLEIEYITGVSDDYNQNTILPILSDLLIYELDPSITKNASSIKEGDVSVNFDNTTNLYSNIQSRLLSLKNNKTRCKML